MPATVLPIELELDTPLYGQEHLVLIGPSFRGGVYRSAAKPYFLRAVPIAWAPLEVRAAFAHSVGAFDCSGIAPVIQTEQHANSGLYLIRYQIPESAVPLPEILASQERQLRLDCCPRILAALPLWWQTLGHMALPMPADMVLLDDGTINLLPWHAPQHQLPILEDIFDYPERATFLAPEIVRGLSVSTYENLDFYAIGMVLSQCFFHFPANSGIEAILQAAIGASVAKKNRISKLPAWLERLPVTRDAIAIIQQLTATDPMVRASLNLHDLTIQMRNYVQQMNPLVAVAELRTKNQPAIALALLCDILSIEETYELLMLAGIISTDIDSPLQSVDFFARAININSARHDAYIEQTRAITATSPSTKNISEKLDAMLRHNLQLLSVAEQSHLALEIANYLLRRNKFIWAHQFLYQHIYDGKTWLWWKAELNLACVEALIGQNRLREAQQFLEEIKRRFLKARNNSAMDTQETHKYGGIVVEMERMIHDSKSRTTGGI